MSTLTISLTHFKSSDDEGAKRQYMPYLLEWACPQCGNTNGTDFREDYLSYPTWDAPYKLNLSCYEDGCGFNHVIHVVPRLVMEVVAPGVTIVESNVD